MTRNEIIDAYVFLRENNHSIPDDTLDFMKDASLKAYDKIHERKCDCHKVLMKEADGQPHTISCEIQHIR